MTATPALLPVPSRQRPETEYLPEADRGLLDMLRRTAARCRAAPREDLFRACALLGADPSSSAPTYAEALFRTLDQGIDRPANIFKPGCPGLSFDERWLIALISAFRRGDEASATFLTERRLAKASRRSIGFLARGLARGLDSV
ncbi:hypothetical protein ROJ8625_00986 [Roseivivax jejudonensis]|uniref:Uncharacterized protein n=1 Tax=Roseivivax jejudonensis TaxID=1529041 RepID=A0A1X6YKH1_9RHOB|nr:hypothetical protein [Roseivivax jejudonensis]SLN24071.1 hypothetical protein ROJ8625_00986 [Roseivivax jejudonensis]